MVQSQSVAHMGVVVKALDIPDLRIQLGVAYFHRVCAVRLPPVIAGYGLVDTAAFDCIHLLGVEDNQTDRVVDIQGIQKEGMASNLDTDLKMNIVLKLIITKKSRHMNRIVSLIKKKEFTKFPGKELQIAVF